MTASSLVYMWCRQSNTYANFQNDIRKAACLLAMREACLAGASRHAFIDVPRVGEPTHEFVRNVGQHCAHALAWLGFISSAITMTREVATAYRPITTPCEKVGIRFAFVLGSTVAERVCGQSVGVYPYSYIKGTS